MSRRNATWVVRTPVLGVAVLLPAAVLALTTGEADAPLHVVADGRVGLTAYQLSQAQELPTTTVAPRPTTSVARTTTSVPPASTWHPAANGVT
jgi:hypothetical protein